jgi:DNA end-binding protein Ku
MVDRSIAAATISFGLVTVPIRIYAATESSSAVSFNLLHGKCKTRLKQQYVCPKDEEVVARDQMVRGYEFAKDQYVAFTEAELNAMAEEKTKTIEISEFVPLAKVDPIYFEATYYLGPDKGGEKAYRLLSAAMRQSGKCALAKWAARGRGYLVMMRPLEGGLAMQVLHYADEVRPFTQVPVGDAAIGEAELKLAKLLIDRGTSEEFRPEAYKDEVKARYHEAIKKKVDGQEVTAVAVPEAPRGQIIDLMQALKASLERKGKLPAAAAKQLARARRANASRARRPRTAQKRTA